MVDISIIVPCYNEADGIAQLRNRLASTIANLRKKYEVELIFVDDGSTDRTNELIRKNFPENFVRLITHNKNMNLGAAIKTGFSAARGEILLTIDSDCTYAPENMPKLIARLKDCDIVTASPYHPNGNVVGVPRHRLLLSRGVTMLYSIVAGRKLYTWTALFRAYKRSAISDISISHNNFIAVVEILIKAVKKGKKISELPETLYVRKYGVSKMKILSTIIAHLKFLLESVQIIRFTN
ncbi:MAG: glycosyltransferase [DPANN group archaeon]|nr:glycosyltransferase [DPANN group archaeon]